MYILDKQLFNALWIRQNKKTVRIKERSHYTMKKLMYVLAISPAFFVVLERLKIWKLLYLYVNNNKIKKFL